MIVRYNVNYILKVEYTIESTVVVLYFINGDKIAYDTKDNFEKFKIIDSVSNRSCCIEIEVPSDKRYFV